MSDPDPEKVVGSQSNPTAAAVTKLYENHGDEDQRGTENPLSGIGSRGVSTLRPSAPPTISAQAYSSDVQPSQQQQPHRLVTTYPSMRSQQNIYGSEIRSATTKREHQSSSQVLVQNSTMHGEAAGNDQSSHLQQSAVDVRLRRPPGLHQQPFGHIKPESSELVSSRMQVMHDVGTVGGHAATQLFSQQQHPCPPLPSGQPAHRIVVHQQQSQGSMSRSPSTQSQPYIGSQRFYTKSLEAAMTAKMPNANILFADASPKEKYRDLKRKLKMLVYENESYQEELRNLQRKLLKISRDKNFLLDRLSNYEGQGSPSSEDPDSDASEKTLEEKAPARGRKRGSKGQSSGGKRNRQHYLDSAGVALNGTQYAPPQPTTTVHRSAASMNHGGESQPLVHTPDGDTKS